MSAKSAFNIWFLISEFTKNSYANTGVECCRNRTIHLYNFFKIYAVQKERFMSGCKLFGVA